MVIVNLYRGLKTDEDAVYSMPSTSTVPPRTTYTRIPRETCFFELFKIP